MKTTWIMMIGHIKYNATLLSRHMSVTPPITCEDWKPLLNPKYVMTLSRKKEKIYGVADIFIK